MLLSQTLSDKDRKSIYNDVTRTQPEHCYFAHDYGTGQKALFAILKCIVITFPEMGYTQGLNYICAFIQMYCTA